MGLRNDITYLQFKNATANTVLGWNASGVPFHMGAFVPATSLLAGTIGLVPAPIAGQHLHILSNAGWIPNTGGGGGVDGTGVANRLAFWTDANSLSNMAELNLDPTNKILKIGTLNLSRADIPAGGSADGDLTYYPPALDFLCLINGVGVNLTRQAENVLGSGVVLYELQESDRNKYVETTSNSPVVIQLPIARSDNFSCTIVKGGAGDITLTVTGVPAPALVATASTITTQRGAAVVYHSNNVTNVWKAYGNLG
jgi:hypothetical protein